MNINLKNFSQMLLALLFDVLLSAVPVPAQALDISDVPLNVGISAAKPNILLLIDSSGSMTSGVTTSTGITSPSSMPAGFTYNCKAAATGGVTPPAIPASPLFMIVNSTGTPRFCKSSTLCSSSNQTSFGRNSKCFDNKKNYNVAYFQGATLAGGPYTGLQLNWYFSKGTFTTGSLDASLSVTTPRIDIAKEAANDLVTSLTPDTGAKARVRMGLAVYDSSSAQGGKLLTEIKDLDPTLATSLNTKINAITPSGNTPLATALSDIGKYYATGETNNLTLHPSTTKTKASVNTVFSKADGTTSHSITNATCTTTPCTNTLASPILGYCQKSFAILISDGLPNGDREISPALRDYTGDCATKGLCVATSDTSITLPGAGGVALNATGSACNSSGNWYNKACKNGTKAGRVYETGGSDYLDDVAKGLFEMDLRPTLDAARKVDSLDKNNVVTYTIGLADPSLQAESVLKDAAAVGGGKFFFAEDSKALASALADTIQDIASKISSSASVVANSAKLDINSAIFQGKFDSADWTGSFTMFPLGVSEDVNGNGILDFTDTNNNGIWDSGEPTEDVNGNGILDGGAVLNPIWNAVDHFPAFADRKIFTYNPTVSPSGVAFLCDNLSNAQKTSLGISLTTGACTSTTDIGVWRLNYIRGDWSHEQKNETRTDADTLRSADPAIAVFRNRTHLNKKTHAKISPDPWVLGDIVNSNPVYVSDENYNYDQLPSAEGGSSYKAFVTANASRRKMAYVGANDGMLHGFDASATGADAGKEILAYIPNAIYDRLNALSSPDYSHQYLVDGSPRVADAYIGSAWHTLLVSTTGAGGKSVFALDITDPSNFNGSNVLWEINDTTSPNSTDLTTDTSSLRGFASNLGFTLPQPSIVRMYNGSWAAIVANGYGSVNNLAVLYIIDVQTGHLITAIDTKAGSATSENGLSTPIAVDTNNDKIVDAIYAGDLLGNMWKFDVSSTSPSDWKVAYGTASTPAPLFVACSNPSACDSTRQPITSKPQVGGVGVTQSVGTMVYFGTGKYFESTDNIVTNAQTQSFYGIWDNNVPVTKSQLQVQTITSEFVFEGFTVRTSTNNNGFYTAKKGWYMDFLKPSATTSDGERIVTAPLLRNGRIIFNTLIPLPPDGTDVCGAASEGTSWLMEMDALTGSRLPDTPGGAPWDLDGDGQINANDLVPYGGGFISPSGKQSKVGSTGTPGVISSGTLEYKYSSGSKEAEIEVTTEQGGGNTAPGSRQSWRQLY